MGFLEGLSKLAASSVGKGATVAEDAAATAARPAAAASDAESKIASDTVAPLGSKSSASLDAYHELLSHDPANPHDTLSMRPRADIHDTQYDDVIDRLADSSVYRHSPHEVAHMRELRLKVAGDGEMPRLKAQRFDAAEIARMRATRDATGGGGAVRLNAQRFTAEDIAKMRATRNRLNNLPPVRDIQQSGAVAKLRQKALPAVRERPPNLPAYVGTPEHAVMMKKLFPDGLQATATQKGVQFKQGRFGNCAVLSALQTTLTHQPERIAQMLEPLKDGSGVRIHLGQPVNGKNYVDVAYSEIDQATFKKGVQGPPGVRLLERGLARAEKTGGTGPDAATINVLGNGRKPVTTLGFFGGGAKASEIHGNPGAGTGKSQVWGPSRLQDRADETKAVLQRIGEDPKGTLAVAWTGPRTNDPRLVTEHAYAVHGFDAAQDKVTLVNPHNNSKTLELSTDEFLNHFFALDHINPQ